MKTQKARQGMAVLIAALLLVVGLVLAGCDNGSTPTDGKPPQDSVKDAAVTGTDGKPSTATGTVFLSLRNNETQTWENIPVGTITNGTLNFKLPATLDAKYLSRIDDTGFPSGGVTVSPLLVGRGL